MHITSITPSIGVTIGRHTRLYFAYITTAPAALDAPSTMTLHAAPLADVSGLALDEVVFDACRARTTARLILVDATVSVSVVSAPGKLSPKNDWRATSFASSNATITFPGKSGSKMVTLTVVTGHVNCTLIVDW